MLTGVVDHKSGTADWGGEHEGYNEGNEEPVDKHSGEVGNVLNEYVFKAKSSPYGDNAGAWKTPLRAESPLQG